MQNLFVKSDEEFVVKFVVGSELTSGILYCDLDEKSLKETFKDLSLKEEEYEIREYQAKFRRPSFGDTMVLYDSIFSVKNETSVNFNPITARFNKIAALIKEWNLTEDGSFKKPSVEDIMSLHPIIANAIGVQLDVETGGLLS